jgi:hypothetical protein
MYGTTVFAPVACKPDRNHAAYQPGSRSSVASLSGTTWGLPCATVMIFQVEEFQVLLTASGKLVPKDHVEDSLSAGRGLQMVTYAPPFSPPARPWFTV